MHRFGTFDVTDDAEGHVTDSQPIRKSLLQLRPDKIFRRSSKHVAAKDASKPRCRLTLATADGTPTTTKTIINDQRHLPAVTTSELTITGYQPKYTAVVSKSGGEFQPEVECHEIQPKRSAERTGSLRDRWRQLNDEFKRLYQQHTQSPEATPPQVHAPPSQDQPNVTKVNRFKDIDRRFSNIRRVVGNMSARLNNSTSGRTGAPEVTSSKPKVILWPTAGDNKDAQITETEIGERYMSESAHSQRHLYADGGASDYFESVARQNSTDHQHSWSARSTAVAGSEPISWYLDAQSTINRQPNDDRPSSSLRELPPDRSHNVLRRESEQTLVPPPGECEYKTTCNNCSASMTSSDAEDDDDDASDVSDHQMTSRSRDEKQLFGTVQRSRDPEVDRRDDVTFRHGVNVGLPEATVLMTSSLRREGALRVSKETQQQQQQQQRVRDTAAVRPVRSRCSSHGFHSTLFPTANGSSLIDKPEVDISRSRDGVMTSQYDDDWRGTMRVSTSERVKPAIEMTRQQVLNVYVLNDRQTGSDVTDHVTRAPASRRAVSASPSDSNRCGAAGVSYFPVKSRGAVSPEVSCRLSVGCDVSTDVTDADRRAVQPAPAKMRVMQSHPRTSSCERQLHRPTFTRCSSCVPDKPSTNVWRKSTNNPSFYKQQRNHADVRTASLERTNGSTDCSINVRRKPSRDSSRDANLRLRPAYVGSASFSRSSDKASGKNTSRKVDHDEERRNGCRFTKKKNERRMLSVHDDEEFDVGERTASGCVGTTSSTARASTHNDDIRGRLGVTTERRQAWTTCPPHRADLQNCYQQRQSTSLQRDNHRSRRLDNWGDSRTQSYWTTRPAYNGDYSSVDDDVDWMNSRWIKRQIHLPVSRRRRQLCSDIQHLQRRTSSEDTAGGDHTVNSERCVVNSRTDPHNICFSRRPNNSSLADRVSARRAATELICRTHMDPTVRVEFTTDNNGNLLKVTEISQVVTETVDHLDNGCQAGHVISMPHAQVDFVGLPRPEVVSKPVL